MGLASDEKYHDSIQKQKPGANYRSPKGGEEGNSRHIRKHYRDVYHLLMLVPPKERIALPKQLKTDMQSFINGIRQGETMSDDIDNLLLCEQLENIYLSL